jgi:hypothetical protein
MTCCSASGRPRRHPARQAPASSRKAADVYAQLLAAEPHATAERKRELRTEAVQKAPPDPPFLRPDPLDLDLPPPSASGRTKTEVKDKLRARHTELAAGVRTPATYTVGQRLKDWLEPLTAKAEITVTGYRIMAGHLTG